MIEHRDYAGHDGFFFLLERFWSVSLRSVYGSLRRERKSTSRFPIDEPYTISVRVDAFEVAVMNINTTEPLGSIASLPFRFLDRVQQVCAL